MEIIGKNITPGKAFWSWEILNDTFNVGPSFSELIKELIPNGQKSKKSVSSCFTSTDFGIVKELLRKEFQRTDSSIVSCSSTHKELSGTLHWIGEIIKRNKDDNAPVVIVGKVTGESSETMDFSLSTQEKAFLFDQMMSHLPQSIFFKDDKSRFIAVSKESIEKFGVNNLQEVLGKTDFDIFDEEHAQKAFDGEQRILKTGEAAFNQTEKETYLEENRNPTWASVTKLPLKNLKGEVVGVFGITNDITDLKLSLQENRKLKRELQTILDSAPNLVFVKDAEGKYQMANQATADFYGFQKEEMIGKTDIEIGIDPENVQRFNELDQKVIATGKTIFLPEDKFTRNDGKTIWSQTIKVPYNPDSDSGHQDAVLSIVTNITERKNREMELSESLDIIGEQNKRLNNFAHIVSHNLRNYAGTISMLLELYNSEESEEEKEDHIQNLVLAASRLNETIADLNEIIDEQFKYRDECKEVSFNKYFSKIEQILTTNIEKHNVVINKDIPEELVFTYNPSYLESIILNLFTNAIKYRHPDRKPVIDVKAYQSNDSVFFEISDNGQGIDLEKFGNQLFGMYKTFHSNEDSKGIGLFITKSQVENMGGAIEVESEPGQGTAFRIKLN